eukprot:COSAG01_NODE_422_length_17262_cov_42.635903_11_plen_192_part_00
MAQLHAPGKSKRALVRRSLRNPRISRNRRNLQNRNSAAAEIAIRFGPEILLECARLKTGPKYPCTRIDYGYKSSFSLNHYVQSLLVRPAHQPTAASMYSSLYWHGKAARARAISRASPVGRRSLDRHPQARRRRRSHAPRADPATAAARSPIGGDERKRNRRLADKWQQRQRQQAGERRGHARKTPHDGQS